MDNITSIYKWNPWIGCHKISQGCKHCSSSHFFSNYHSTVYLDLHNFDLPLQRKANGQYYIPQNSYIALSYSSDFFLEDMDSYRPYLWNIIKARSDCKYIMATKRPDRIEQFLPKDWGDGWNNVHIECTAENQKRVDERLPIYLSLPLKNYTILTEPLLEQIHLENYLATGKIDLVCVEGEFCFSDEQFQTVRPCDYQWVESLAEQCKQYDTKFSFDICGVKWIDKTGQKYLVNPFGTDMIVCAKECNLSTGKIFDLDEYKLIDINKE